MKQYLLSVHMVEGTPVPSEEEMQQAYKDVDAFNAELQAEGAWVFAGGLHPPATATVVRAPGRRGAHHRRPVRRDQGAARRLLGHQGRRPRRRPGAGRPRARRPAAAPVEVRPFQDEPEA